MSCMRSYPLPLLVALLPAPLAAGNALLLEVRETAGIRRFGYPVEARLDLDPPISGEARYRLLAEQKPVEAQFRPLETKDGLVSRVAIDFEGNFLPFETRQYRLEYGPDVEAGPEPRHGLAIEESGAAYRISNGSYLVWEVPRDLTGLLRAVKAGSVDYLDAGSEGLFLQVAGGARRRIVAAPAPGAADGSARIVKKGPIDCVLRFAGVEDAGGRRLPWDLELEFPRSKSWVRVSFAVADPEDIVEALGADLRLRLEGDRAFADFGADTLVYAAIEKGQAASFRAGLPVLAHRLGGQPFWEVLRGPPGRLEPYVASGQSGLDRVEGWAHVMDRDRCTALAVRDFGKKTEDRIEVESAGRLAVWRDYSKKAAPAPRVTQKTLVFWMHFVNTPPHVGAVTSPQAMLAPLETTWRR